MMTISISVCLNVLLRLDSSPNIIPNNVVCIIAITISIEHFACRTQLLNVQITTWDASGCSAFNRCSGELYVYTLGVPPTNFDPVDIVDSICQSQDLATVLQHDLWIKVLNKK